MCAECVFTASQAIPVSAIAGRYLWVRQLERRSARAVKADRTPTFVRPPRRAKSLGRRHPLAGLATS